MKKFLAAVLFTFLATAAHATMFTVNGQVLRGSATNSEHICDVLNVGTGALDVTVSFIDSTSATTISSFECPALLQQETCVNAYTILSATDGHLIYCSATVVGSANKSLVRGVDHFLSFTIGDYVANVDLK